MLFTPSLCHPDRYDAGDGLCHRCRRGRFFPAECHPERRYHAIGLCASCYKKHPIPRPVTLAKLVEQDGRCAYCKRFMSASQATADHRISRRNGGTDEPANIVAACQPCNSRKWATSR